MTRFGDENVGWFDVAMDDAFDVGGIEGIGNLDGEGENGLGFERSAGDFVFQGDAFRQFHGDEGLTVLLADIMNGTDIRVIESRCP
jgi:hypothetical protein